MRAALKMGLSVQEISEATKIDPWFLENLKQILDLEAEIQRHKSG